MSAEDDDGGSGRFSTSPYRPPSINELDDIDSALKWMAKGRADTKGFAKYLPHTSQDLRHGKVTPEQLACDLNEIYAHKTLRMAGIESDPIMGISILAAIKGAVMVALPANFFHTETDRTDTSVEFSSDLHSNLLDRARGNLNPENSSLLLKESLDEVCEMWASRLDKALFRGKAGRFLKKCPLYGVTPETFHRPGMPLHLSDDDIDNSWSREQKIVSDFKKESLLRVARNVARGMQDVKHMCWECESFAKCDLQHCAKCKTASYCSRDCQVSAWKKGHKLKCNALRSKYAAFEKSFKTVGDAYKNPIDSAAVAVIECGIALSDETDYLVLEMMVSVLTPLEDNELNKKYGGAQMEFFYKNIARVARGEFWFYDDADADDAAYAVYKEANLTIEKEMDYFMRLCMFMVYEYAEMPPVIEFVKPLIMEMKDENGGVGMPASRFIEIYKLCRKTIDSTDRFRMQREVRNKCIRVF